MLYGNITLFGVVVDDLPSAGSANPIATAHLQVIYTCKAVSLNLPSSPLLTERQTSKIGALYYIHYVRHYYMSIDKESKGDNGHCIDIVKYDIPRPCG